MEINQKGPFVLVLPTSNKKQIAKSKIDLCRKKRIAIRTKETSSNIGGKKEKKNRDLYLKLILCGEKTDQMLW